LKENGFDPVQTDTTATCTMTTGDDGTKITNMRLHVRCEVSDIDEERLDEIVREADEHCPVSNLLRNGLPIEITTALIQPHGA
jgi:organic hydroperoxide reductase OsmC/OhrA